MAIKISASEAKKLRSRFASMQARVRNAREKTEELAGHVIQTGEIGLMTFGMGLVSGRWVDAQGRPGVELLGIPLDLGLGIALHALGFFSGTKYNEHFHNLGDGALAAYFTLMGVGVGTRMRREAGTSSGYHLGPGDRTGFSQAVAGGQELSDSELAAIARS